MHPDSWTSSDHGSRDKIRRQHHAYDPARERAKPQRRPDGSESFKCGHCRQFVGPTISGGRHRNHCPLCLSSRHVDRSFPGDRASDCRSLMEPVGVCARRNGEQLVVHRCRGCGTERQNRIAADDNAVALLRLPPVAPPRGGRSADATELDEAAAS